MDQLKVRRFGAMTAVTSFALVVLAACGGSAVEGDITRVPEMSEAAVQATNEAAMAATPGAAGVASPATAATETAPAETAPAAAAQAAEPVTIVSKDIMFEPTKVTIPANTDVTITLPNEGVTAHNFSIDALDISVDIAPGETKELVINAPAGTYEFYCNVPGHKEAGMFGTLTVAEGGAAAAPAASPAAAAAPAEATAAVAEATPAAAESAAAETPAEAAQAAAAEPVEIVSRDIVFDPDEATIPANTDVTFILPNEGVTAHNFSIDELDISVDQAPGSSEEIIVNAPAGTYQFYCNVPGHKEAGMVGELTVE